MKRQPKLQTNVKGKGKPKDQRRFVNPQALKVQIEYFTALHVTSEGVRMPPLAEGLIQMLNHIQRDLETGRECVLELE
jgi:hypothetical protein